MDIKDFKALIADKGHELYRDMPWRQDIRPYYILVSELMLQQTQVERVVPKFIDFVAEFPTISTLAAAPLAKVLSRWSGLGYNRRAKYLHDSAKMIMQEYGGEFPSQPEQMKRLKGVGVNTAGALQAYAFNQPALFIETNVRTVYIHHFFKTGELVDDSAIITLLDQTIDREHSREFYWALMDYGSYLKRNGTGNIRQSKQYKKQTALKGSVREIRGQIMKCLARADMHDEELKMAVVYDERFDSALDGLVKDGLVTKEQGGIVHLTK